MTRKGFHPTKPAMGCLIFLGLVLAVGVVNDLRGRRSVPTSTSAPVGDLGPVRRAHVTPEPTKTAAEQAREKAERVKEEARARADEAKEKARIRKDGIAGRVLFAEQFVDKAYLERGMDVHVRVEGKDKTTLRLVWVLWGRPSVYREMQDAKFEETLKAIGFKRVIFSTDFGDSGWTWKLE